MCIRDRDEAFRFPEDVQEGDALIVFTKRAVLDLSLIHICWAAADIPGGYNYKISFLGGCVNKFAGIWPDCILLSLLLEGG